MKATIFDIERNSFVDGPGIRTTVFFKGCNLKCAWCHNPESQSNKAQMMFHANKCTGCGNCKEKCPNALEKCEHEFWKQRDLKKAKKKENKLQVVIH